MSKVSDEVYDGIRCAVCEERFQSGEDQRGVPGTAERAHVACWILDDCTGNAAMGRTGDAQ